MKSKLKSWIFGVLIVAILALPIVVDYFNNKKVAIISYDKYSQLVTNGDFALVYFGDTKDSDYTDVNQTLVETRKEFDVNVNAFDYTKLSDTEKSEFLKANNLDETTNGWIFIKDGSVQYIQVGDTNKTKLDSLVDKYYNGIIPEEEIAYKVPTDSAAYKKIVNSKDVNMSVFGKTSCSWCTKFKLVYNEVASESKVNIYYFDSDVYNQDEYDKILKMGLKIPAACSDSGAAVPLENGFGTPLTLFTKNGKVIDCISGYVNKETLETKLKSVGMLK